MTSNARWRRAPIGRRTDHLAPRASAVVAGSHHGGCLPQQGDTGVVAWISGRAETPGFWHRIASSMVVCWSLCRDSPLSLLESLLQRKLPQSCACQWLGGGRVSGKLFPSLLPPWTLRLHLRLACTVPAADCRVTGTLIDPHTYGQA